MKTISINRSVKTSVTPSPRVLETAAMFGLGVDEERELPLVPACQVPLPHLNQRRGIVFVTGPSGSGKSTILKLIADRCAADPLIASHHLDQLPALADVPLIDGLDAGEGQLKDAMAALSLAGLGDAFVMLRRPCELSDGQRYRARIAQIVAQIARRHRRKRGMNADHFIDRKTEQVFAHVIFADEFCSTLDRLTAQTVARNVRRWIDHHAPPCTSFIAATTHDDLLEPLAPDVLVWKGLGDQVEVLTR